MRIEKISDNKIRIMVDGQEAEKLNLSFQNISNNTPEAQQLLRIAIKMAEENVDFSVDGSKLFVEAVQDDAWDGFGMLITKVSCEEELNQAIHRCSYQGTIKRNKLKIRTEQIEGKHIFCFSDFDHACMAADEIVSYFSGDSSLFKYQSKFYLCLSPQSMETFSKTETILLEFGEKVENSRYMLGRLNEYGERMISLNALEVMKEYFPVYELNR